ncbi:tau 95 subunit of transcription factor TFIIIC [Globomyces sp. JEL0801]|nr:tau 95 subunit of transcription factor TFIIIC [Globomyces sp. JEL0801]
MEIDEEINAEGNNTDDSIKLMTNKTNFYGIEYPGYCDGPRISEEIINTLGGMDRIQEGFKNNFIECKFRYQDPLAHSINGPCIQTSNPILQITRKTHKVTGEIRMSYKIVGSISKTCRFRAINDFQVSVMDPISGHNNDHIVQLIQDMWTLDVEKFSNFKMKSDTPLPALPPPVFSRTDWPIDYGYKENPAITELVKVNEETGETTTEIVKRTTDKTSKYVLTIGYTDKPPTEPSATLPALPSANDEEDSHLSQIAQYVEKLKLAFEERPICSRAYLANKLRLNSYKEEKTLVKALGYVAYTTIQGPWRNSWIKFGIDPKKDRQYRMFQMINLQKISKAKQPRVNVRFQPVFDTFEANTRPTEPDWNSHIFDGINEPTLQSYQIIDIIEPTVKPLLFKDGWFIQKHLNMVRLTMKKVARKFHSPTNQLESEDDQQDKSMDEDEGDNSASGSDHDDNDSNMSEDMEDIPEDIINSEAGISEFMKNLLNDQTGIYFSTNSLQLLMIHLIF